MATVKTKPKCKAGTACGFACISGKKQCSERIKALDAAELLKRTGVLAEADSKPEEVEPYEVVRKLGAGAFGTVELTDRGSVVKTMNLPKTWTTGPETAAKEYEGLQLMHKLGIGPKPIAITYGPGKIIKLEMSTVTGSTLKDKLESEDSDEAKAKAFGQSIRTIFKLHSEGYTHGDFHGGNAMLDDKGAQLIDAGMLRKVGEPSGEVYFGGKLKDSPQSSGYKDIAKLFKTLANSFPPAEKLYDDLTDSLDKSGAFAQYKAIRKDKARHAEAEQYLHSEYLKTMKSLGY